MTTDKASVPKDPSKQPETQVTPDSQVILYDYDPTRSQSMPLKLFDRFKGYMQTDAYEGYGAVCRADELNSVGCMTHARRKRDEALEAQRSVDPYKQKSAMAASALRQIRALYRIEREIKQLPTEENLAVRLERAAPLLKEFRRWLDTNILIVPPRSTLGKAMNYLDKQWDKLTVYTMDGRLRIDYNLCENAVRPFVMGRKSWLFAASVEGANASASLHSILETAKANGHVPHSYIPHVLTRLPATQLLDESEALLPINVQPEKWLAA